MILQRNLYSVACCDYVILFLLYVIYNNKSSCLCIGLKTFHNVMLSQGGVNCENEPANIGILLQRRRSGRRKLARSHIPPSQPSPTSISPFSPPNTFHFVPPPSTATQHNLSCLPIRGHILICCCLPLNYSTHTHCPSPNNTVVR